MRKQSKRRGVDGGRSSLSEGPLGFASTELFPLADVIISAVEGVGDSFPEAMSFEKPGGQNHHRGDKREPDTSSVEHRT